MKKVGYSLLKTITILAK